MKYIYVIEFLDGSVKRVEVDAQQNISLMLKQGLIEIKGGAASAGIYCTLERVRCISEKISQ